MMSSHSPPSRRQLKHFKEAAELSTPLRLSVLSSSTASPGGEGGEGEGGREFIRGKRHLPPFKNLGGSESLERQTATEFQWECDKRPCRRAAAACGFTFSGNCPNTNEMYKVNCRLWCRGRGPLVLISYFLSFSTAQTATNVKSEGKKMTPLSLIAVLALLKCQPCVAADQLHFEQQQIFINTSSTSLPFFVWLSLEKTR